MRLLNLLLAVLAAVLLMAGAWTYRAERQRLGAEAYEDLRAIQDLKVKEIAAWRQERLADATVISRNENWAAEVERWRASGAQVPPDSLVRALRAVAESYRYGDVLLVDPEGIVEWSLSGQTARLDGEAARAFEVASRGRKSQLSDLYLTGDDPAAIPQLAAVAPLVAGDGPEARPVGGILLVVDARVFLFPLLQSWPVQSETAETLLVRRDGDHVLFLNEIRHRQGTALRLRIPLDQTRVPAVKAALGESGIVDGVDYRGEPVLAALEPIPGSTWRMVAKVDEAEALAVWRQASILILALTLLATALAGAAALVVWHRVEATQYRTLYRAEAELRASEARYGTTLMSIGDGVIATDPAGRVQVLNPVAETLTGWSSAEARERDVGEVLRLVNELSRQPVENPVGIVLREGRQVGLANHTVLVARDGREIPIADSGAPIRDENGTVLGAVLVFRDQTEERRATEKLRSALAEREVLLRELYHRTKNNMQVVKGILDLRVASSSSEELQRLAQEMGHTIQSMAMVHKMLYESHSLVTIDVKSYLEQLGHLVHSGYRSTLGDVDIRLDIEPLQVDIDTAVPLGLVVNELLANAFKHAFPKRRAGAVCMKLQRNGGDLVLEIADNGVGVPPGFDIHQQRTFGLASVVTIVEHQLAGEIALATAERAAYRIRFPYRQPEGVG